MGFSGKGFPMDANGDWPSKKIKKHRSRDVSPVPSHFSEPASFLQHRDVIASLPCLPGVKRQLRDEEDDDDVRSLKSLPAVMTGKTLQPRDKRSYRHSENHKISGLPPLISTRCSLIVKGTGCKTVPKLPPITKSWKTWKEIDPPRPPCRSGCRPDKMEFSSAKPVHALMHPKIVPAGQTSLSFKAQGNGPCLLPAKASGVSLRSRLTFQSPVVQAVYPISPDTMQQMRQTDRACQPLRSVLKKAPNGGVFDWPMAAHLLEPFSGFQEHLCRQILHSPLPYLAALPQVHFPCLQDQVDLLPTHRGPYGSLMERTVELCNSQGQKLPKITMTCPTPSPKYLCRTEFRHAA
ncbi:uncharacterized protein si:dkey-39a18.1 [Carassius gibelio]|uniref:uncharacterized protein si:dkey-39a18.1 n=1 Tax=Carassius gibelio TaxID=101364 RepID=UPI00227759B3|nr:uncharacterized protein si:dkey-39a18.1 [Carassius gibelio]XP_052410320.1 uncharacterized protein si:dkey-39a18.1 [Carassius gibelio]XP_052410321.1 uncharacterized protein si:dkey-39a18.1 [Carassius gibelio]